MTPGEQSQLLYGIRPRRRDRFGEVIDEPSVHRASPPAVTPEMRAEWYYRARRRAERIIQRLTAAELAAVGDALAAERGRRAAR